MRAHSAKGPGDFFPGAIRDAGAISWREEETVSTDDSLRVLTEALQKIAHGPYETEYEYERFEECQNIARAALVSRSPQDEPTISTGGWEMAHDVEMQEGPGGTMRVSRSPEPRPEPEIFARARAFVEGGISFDTRPEKQGPLIETLWNLLRVVVRAGASGGQTAEPGNNSVLGRTSQNVAHAAPPESLRHVVEAYLSDKPHWPSGDSTRAIIWAAIERAWHAGLPGTSGEPAPERELVQRFSVAMAERLRFNRNMRGKSGWEWMTPKQLLHRAEQELGELRRAVESEAPALDVVHEAADVGNFCAMLATVYEGRVARTGTEGTDEGQR